MHTALAHRIRNAAVLGSGLGLALALSGAAIANSMEPAAPKAAVAAATTKTTAAAGAATTAAAAKKAEKPAAKPAAKKAEKPAAKKAKPAPRTATKAVKPVKKPVKKPVTKHVAAKAAPATGWVTPVTAHFTFSAGYSQGGALWAHKHSGQDFAAPTGTPVHAAASGTVVTNGWGGAYGNQIVIRHANGMYTQYGHLSQSKVYTGQHVTAGSTIGLIGSTGNSTGPHLHFEVRTTPYYGSSVNPLNYLAGKGVRY
ncbi:M23 family metallopeptidase [Streptomyces sp. NPDC051940]|uniref:M23 family metallopeptidase n=1 Tax=Streptomyces sp. NPDC051940 TaxID=3155675 RepID=UPI003416D6CF